MYSNEYDTRDYERFIGTDPDEDDARERIESWREDDWEEERLERDED